MQRLTRRLSFRKVSEILGIELDDVRALVVEERRIPAIYVTQLGYLEPYEYQLIKVDAEGRVFDMAAGGLNSDIHTGFLRIERVELDKFMLDEGLRELAVRYKAELGDVGAVEMAVLAQPQETAQNELVEPQSAPDPAPVSDEPVSRSAAQDAVILETIRRVGHEPLSLPKNDAGKPGIKAAVRGELVAKHKLFPQGGRQFDKAWDRLSAFKEIAYRD